MAQTVTQYTAWKRPTKVARYSKINSGTTYAWTNLAKAYDSDTSTYASIPTSGGLNSTHSSERLYFYGFGFSIPTSTTNKTVRVRKIEVKRTLAKGTSTGSFKEEILRLRLGNNSTYIGWGNNNASSTVISGSKGAKSTFTTSKEGYNPNKSTSTSYWGAGTVSQSYTNSSYFGIVYQLKGTTSTWSTPNLYDIQMRIQYETITPDTPTYTYTLTRSPTSIPSDSSYSSLVTVDIQNSNMVTGKSPALTLSINDCAVFSDGTKSKSISAQSIGGGSMKTLSYYVKGTKAGTATITLKQGSTTLKTTTITVTSPPTPKYSLTQSLGKNDIKKGEMTTITTTIRNTNNIEGHIDKTVISVNEKLMLSGYGASININGTQFDFNIEEMKNSFTMSEMDIPANGYFSFTFNVEGVQIGTGSITCSNPTANTATTQLLVGGGVPKVAYLANIKEQLLYNSSSDLKYTIVNNDDVNVVVSGIQGEVSNDSIIKYYENNVLSSTFSRAVNDELSPGDSITYTIPVKTFNVGSAQFILKATVEGELSNETRATTNVYNDIVDFNVSYSFNKTSVNIYEYFLLNAVLHNNSNNGGYSPTISLNLPNGLQTSEGLTTITFPSYYIEAGGSKNLSESIVATIAGDIQWILGGTTYTITVIDNTPVGTPAFDTHCLWVDKTTLEVGDSTQLHIQYKVLNGVFPAIIPSTTITLPPNVSFADDSQTKTIPQKILNGNTFTDTFTIKGVSEGIGIIETDMFSNLGLANQDIKIKTEIKPAEFITTTQLLPSTEIDLNTNLTLKVVDSNVGGKSEVLSPATITLSNGLTFTDGTTIKPTAERTLAPNEQNIQNFIISATSLGTKTIDLYRSQNNFHQTYTVLVTNPTVAEYEYSFIPDIVELPLPDEITIYMNPKLRITNTNNFAGTSVQVTISLSSNLKFEDDTSTKTVGTYNIIAGGEEEITLSRIKGTAVGRGVITIEYGENTDTVEVDVINPLPDNKGWVNIDTCTFEENEADDGGAICNRGKLTYSNCTFINNDANSCPNINDNGVCKQ